MLILLSLFICVAIFGTGFLQVSIGPCSVLETMCLFTTGYYIWLFCSKLSKLVQLKRSRTLLILFLFAAIVSIEASYFDLYSHFYGGRLQYNSAFIPRQAFYLAFLPFCMVDVRARSIERLHSSMAKHSLVWFAIFYSMYVGYGMYNGASSAIALNVNITVLLSATLLLSQNINLGVWACSALILASPIGQGGELTQVIVRALFALTLIAEKAHLYTYVEAAVHFVSMACVVLTILLGVMSGSLNVRLDGNSEWRLKYWGDEVQTVFQSFGLGVGFGTSYASDEFVSWSLQNNPSGPFSAGYGIVSQERLFTTGPHNSFISILFRLGVIGLLFFTLMLQAIWIEQGKEEISPFGCFLYHCGIAIITVNVGLESPTYLFTFLVCISANRLALTKLLPKTKSAAYSSEKYWGTFSSAHRHHAVVHIHGR